LTQTLTFDCIRWVNRYHGAHHASPQPPAPLAGPPDACRPCGDWRQTRKKREKNKEVRGLDVKKKEEDGRKIGKRKRENESSFFKS
jgi:hypothetical protein